MKRLTAEAMKDMPVGTMFAYGGEEEPGVINTPREQIMIFAGHMRQHNSGSWDWCEASLADLEHDGTDELIEIWMDMEVGGSHPISDEPSFGRHGLFPMKPVFFVLEAGDLVKLSALIERSIAIAGGEV